MIVYGGDPVADAPGFAEAAAKGTLVYLGTHRNATSAAAEIVVPMSAWAEKDGVFVNGRGRLQRIRRAVARPGEAREDWRFLADWLGRVADDPQPAGLPQLRRLVGETLPVLAGVDLNALPVSGAVPVSAGPGGEA